MDVNVIIDDLLERIKGLTKENSFLKAQVQAYENRIAEEAQKASEEVSEHGE